MSSIKITPTNDTIKVRLWFRDAFAAHDAMDLLEKNGIVDRVPGDLRTRKANQVVYLKVWQENGPRGWGFYDEEQGTLAKIAVGDMTIEDRS
jgi:hypothetical protein